jgi:hypothetical protein
VRQKLDEAKATADAKYREYDDKYHISDKLESAAASATETKSNLVGKARRLQHGQGAALFEEFSSGKETMVAAEIAAFFARCGLELSDDEAKEALGLLRCSVHYGAVEGMVELPVDPAGWGLELGYDARVAEVTEGGTAWLAGVEVG